MDDSKSVPDKTFKKIIEQPVKRIIHLNRPLKFGALERISHFFRHFGINHQGILCELEGGGTFVLHRLTHNVTLTRVTQLDRSWQEGLAYEFCESIPLREIWVLAGIGTEYSLFLNNCIHTSNKILNWSAGRACCKDNRTRIASVSDTGTVVSTFKQLQSKRSLTHPFGSDEDLDSEKMFNICTTEQHFHKWLNFEEIAGSHVSLLEDIITVDSITKFKTVLSNPHLMQLVDIQRYLPGPRSTDGKICRPISFLAQASSVGRELTHIKSTMTRRKIIMLGLLTADAVVHCYERIQDCPRSLKFKTNSAGHGPTLTKVDRKTMTEKHLTKGQICITVLDTSVHSRLGDKMKLATGRSCSTIRSLSLQDSLINSQRQRGIICNINGNIYPFLAEQTSGIKYYPIPRYMLSSLPEFQLNIMDGVDRLSRNTTLDDFPMTFNYTVTMVAASNIKCDNRSLYPEPIDLPCNPEQYACYPRTFSHLNLRERLQECSSTRLPRTGLIAYRDVCLHEEEFYNRSYRTHLRLPECSSTYLPRTGYVEDTGVCLQEEEFYNTSYQTHLLEGKDYAYGYQHSISSDYFSNRSYLICNSTQGCNGISLGGCILL